MQLRINWSAGDISCGRLEKKKERGQNKMTILKINIQNGGGKYFSRKIFF
jgi:hypothetical protein